MEDHPHTSHITDPPKKGEITPHTSHITDSPNKGKITLTPHTLLIPRIRGRSHSHITDPPNKGKNTLTRHTLPIPRIRGRSPSHVTQYRSSSITPLLVLNILLNNNFTNIIYTKISPSGTGASLFMFIFLYIGHPFSYSQHLHPLHPPHPLLCSASSLDRRALLF